MNPRGSTGRSEKGSTIANHCNTIGNHKGKTFGICRRRRKGRSRRRKMR
jgi:hypothetical protein